MADSIDNSNKGLPLFTQSKQSFAYEQIKKDILNNTYPVGAVLPERKLSDIYNVSRSPIRNALQQLAHEGLLTFIPGKGAVVTEFTIEDIVEVYDLMEVLQIFALNSLPKKTDPVMLETLRIEMINIRQSIDGRDLLSATHRDQNFHACLIKASKNKRLALIYEQLEAQNKRFLATVLDDYEQAENSYKEHMVIYNRLKNDDIEGAIKGIKAHYKSLKKYYLNKLISRLNV